MNRTKTRLSVSINGPWIFWFLTFLFSYYYISKDAFSVMSYAIPSQQYSMWHDVYSNLNNGFVAPVQHWITLIILFTQVMDISLHQESLLRYSKKIYWLRSMFVKTIGIAVRATLFGYGILFILSALRFGLPTTTSWGPYPLSKQPIPVILITSFICRLNISIFAAILYTTLTVWHPLCTQVAFLCISYFTISNLIVMITPPYISFKGVAFACCFSYGFFSTGYYFSNALLAIGIPLILDILLILVSFRMLEKFPERGRHTPHEN